MPDPQTTKNLIADLRAGVRSDPGKLMWEAADEIENLLEQIEQLERDYINVQL